MLSHLLMVHGSRGSGGGAGGYRASGSRWRKIHLYNQDQHTITIGAGGAAGPGS